MAYLASLYTAAGQADRIDARDTLLDLMSAAPLFLKEDYSKLGDPEEAVSA